MLKMIDRAVSVLVTLMVPILLIIGAVRILLTPIFIQTEYRLPHFPDDPYGLTTTERLKWAEYSRSYLVNNSEIDYLGDLRFADGEPLFNERELRHMEDVKVVLKGFLTVLWISLGLIVLGIFWTWRRDSWATFRRGVSRGGWLTILLLVSLLTFALLDFNTFFVIFHRVFFEGETWIFKYTDTLIRLFPIRFWMDVFIAFGILSLGGGLTLGWSLRERRDSRKKQP
jgi:integral membrane protein (TIGR01906 family)